MLNVEKRQLTGFMGMLEGQLKTVYLYLPVFSLLKLILISFLQKQLFLYLYLIKNAHEILQ